MISVIQEHSVDIDLLPEKANILDLGCRGFQFTFAMRELGHTVYPVDIDDLMRGVYTRCAITNYDGFCGMIKNDDPQATKIGPGESIHCHTLETFSKMVGVEFWDMIKADIEGAEYPVIMSLTKAPAKQFSIEFHLHCGQTIKQVHEMVEKLESLGYYKAYHEMTAEHGAGLNYWHSLFILK